ncbi:RadC family protein [Planococcus sp. SE5232]|uniref:RadC family protein n=1 Tax=unclassified Planococcus (in: firmicutes) TaxID=2662419 RepID=UPI003D6B7F63
MEKIVEIIRIKQEVLEVQEKYEFLKDIQIKSPSTLIDAIRQLIGDEDREILLVLCLNIKNKIIAVHRCHVGSINASIVHPREVFKSAILNNAATIVMAHNHPSFDPTPSNEDIQVTKRIVEAGSILGIELLDHIIVGNEEGISLKQKGYM